MAGNIAYIGFRLYNIPSHLHLPQLHPALLQDPGGCFFHRVRQVIYHLSHAALYDLDRTCEARTSATSTQVRSGVVKRKGDERDLRVTVDHAVFAYPLPTCFQQGVLLGVQA